MAESQTLAEERVSRIKITDKVLSNIGLGELIPRSIEARLAEQEGRKPRRISKEIRAKLLAESKTAVVDFFANSTEPLDATLEPAEEIPGRPQINSRLLRVTQGPKAGMVLGTQSEGGQKSLFVTDIASAGRRIDHIDDGHKKEIEQLKKIEARLAEMTNRLYKGDLEAIKSSGELDSMQTEIAGIVEGLKFTRNGQKLEILKRISRCVTFSDSKGRLNPPSKLAIWNTTQKFIAKRISDIEGISGYLEEDRGVVDSSMRVEASRLNSFHATVNENEGRLRILDVNTPLEEANIVGITTNLRALIASCESFKLEPYKTFAAKIIAEISAIIEILNLPNHNEQTEREKAKNAFMRIYSMSKLLNIENELIAVRNKWFMTDRPKECIYAKGLMEELAEIRRNFMTISAAQATRTKDLSPIYGEIYKLLHTVITMLGKNFGKGKTPEDRVEAVKTVERMLKEFSVAKLLIERL
ncbi:MAG: hypothetical protein Q8P62_05395 [Candidatus Peregrinibacteria bacterium]|nr:hypothetical protein [Candidatus Peregrinibacteria bacterium]